MGWKVFDFVCPNCGAEYLDEVIFDRSNEGPLLQEEEVAIEQLCCSRPECGKIALQRKFPAPAGVVYDSGQIASKKAIARAYRLESKIFSTRPGTPERKEMEKEKRVMLTPGRT